ncbi:MAG: hypothetical protein J6N78_02010 [Clostridia bacterium]|nr:hypothetical protein [Clostridia bacterium]
MVLRECKTTFDIEYIYDIKSESTRFIYNKFVTRTLYDDSSLDYHSTITNDHILVVCNDCKNGNSLEVSLVKENTFPKYLTISLKRGFVLNKYILEYVLRNKFYLNKHYTQQAMDQVMVNHNVFVDFTELDNSFKSNTYGEN